MSTVETANLDGLRFESETGDTCTIHARSDGNYNVVGDEFASTWNIRRADVEYLLAWKDRVWSAPSPSSRTASPRPSDGSPKVRKGSLLYPRLPDPARDAFREWLASLETGLVSFVVEGTQEAIDSFYNEYLMLTGEELPQSAQHVQNSKWGLELRIRFPNAPEGILPSETKQTRYGSEESIPRQLTDTHMEWANNDLVKYLFQNGFRYRLA